MEILITASKCWRQSHAPFFHCGKMRHQGYVHRERRLFRGTPSHLGYGPWNSTTAHFLLYQPPAVCHLAGPILMLWPQFYWKQPYNIMLVEKPFNIMMKSVALQQSRMWIAHVSVSFMHFINLQLFPYLSVFCRYNKEFSNNRTAKLWPVLTGLNIFT